MSPAPSRVDQPPRLSRRALALTNRLSATASFKVVAHARNKRSLQRCRAVCAACASSSTARLTFSRAATSLFGTCIAARIRRSVPNFEVPSRVIGSRALWAMIRPPSIPDLANRRHPNPTLPYPLARSPSPIENGFHGREIIAGPRRDTREFHSTTSPARAATFGAAGIYVGECALQWPTRNRRRACSCDAIKTERLNSSSGGSSFFWFVIAPTIITRVLLRYRASACFLTFRFVFVKLNAVSLKANRPRKGSLSLSEHDVLFSLPFFPRRFNRQSFVFHPYFQKIQTPTR